MKETYKPLALVIIATSIIQGNALAFDLTEFSVRGVSLNQNKEIVDMKLRTEFGDEFQLKKTVPNAKLFSVYPYSCRETRRDWQCRARFGERDPNGSVIRKESIDANFNKAHNPYLLRLESRTKVADDLDSCRTRVNSIISSLIEKHGKPTNEYPFNHKISGLRMEKGIQLHWNDGSKYPAEYYMMDIGCHKSGNMGIKATLHSKIIMKAALKKTTKASALY